MKMLNKIIKKKREELKLTQEEVARAIGITRNYLSDMKTGDTSQALIPR